MLRLQEPGWACNQSIKQAIKRICYPQPATRPCCSRPIFAVLPGLEPGTLNFLSSGLVDLFTIWTSQGCYFIVPSTPTRILLTSARPWPSSLPPLQAAERSKQPSDPASSQPEADKHKSNKQRQRQVSASLFCQPKKQLQPKASLPSLAL